MQFDLYYDGAVVAIRILTANLQNPHILLTPDERIDLIQFIADLQNELDNEAERDWIERQSSAY